MNTDINKKIFVIGSGRCGTTWMGQWLQRHPKTFGGHETHIFKILEPLLNKDWAQGLKTWVDRDLTVSAIKDFVNATLGQYKFRKEDQVHLVEHSPVHCNLIDLIKQIYPDALFIYLYRDGRNVVESWLRSTETNDPHVFIKKWIDIVEDMQKRTDDSSILQLRYEHIMENPHESRKITEFLGLDHHYDIDSWEFPVNTPFFVYDYNRWQSLASDMQEEFESGKMLELLTELNYIPKN